ncbi:MAG: NADH-quinone oxidoreductase subunit M, partial [Flavisolibacter sp.]
MVVLLLILVPLIGGLLSFFLRNDRVVKSWALLISLITLFLAIAGSTFIKATSALEFTGSWMGSLGSSFSLKFDGLARILCLLTAISYPIIFIT